MNNMKDFDNILDECLQRLLEGDSIEACLSRYPEHAAELEPLLRTVRNTLKATDIRPRPEFRDRARYQFQMAIREMPVKASRGFFTVFRPAIVTVIMLAIVLLVVSWRRLAIACPAVPCIRSSWPRSRYVWR
jgi:hypothetical protein